MTPQKFIESLQKNTNKSNIDKKQLNQTLINEIEKLGISLDEYIEQVNNKDWAFNLFEMLGPLLPNEVTKILNSSNVAVGTVTNSSPSIYVKELDSGFAIVFHSGLKDFIYRVSRIISTRFESTNSCSFKDNKNDLKHVARHIAEVFWWMKATGTAFGPEYNINSEQQKLAGYIAMESEIFFMAHEVGHIIYGSENSSEAYAEIFNDDIPLIHKEEHIADIFAMTTVMGLFKTDKQNDLFTSQLKYASIEFTLQIFRILESLNIISNNSHPSSKNRLTKIRERMKQFCTEEVWNNISVIALGIEKLFDEIETICHDPKELSSYYEKEADVLANTLDQLLDKCVGNVTPDYHSFYSEAGKLFSVGYPQKFIEHIANISAKFYQEILISETSEYKPNKDSLLLFQKYKLLLGYTRDYMNEPAKTIFAKALMFDF